VGNNRSPPIVSRRQVFPQGHGHPRRKGTVLLVKFCSLAGPFFRAFAHFADDPGQFPCHAGGLLGKLRRSIRHSRRDFWPAC